MRVSRFLPPAFAAATLLLLGANALPTTLRKHRLREESHRLQRRIQEERLRTEKLEAVIRALNEDPFVLERATLEAWNSEPQGTLPLLDDREAITAGFDTE